MNKEIFLKYGKLVEDKFAKLFSDSIESNKQENIYQHWDIKVPIRIDVKGIKKIYRTDEKPNQNFHWIELKGITGKLGWLYGEAEFFAFETESYFIIVEKLKLQDWISKNIAKEFFDEPTINKLYQRYNRLDILTLISTIDLCYLSTAIIKKND